MPARTVVERLSLVEKHLPVCASDAPVRNLSTGDVLFRPGDARTHVYLIEEGTIALFRKRTGGAQDVVEFTFAGDVVGLGFLAKHIFWAKALSKSRVKLLPINALDDLLDGNERTNQRYREAVQREFVARRSELIDAFRGNPVCRVAAFLLALSQLNRHEGRDPCLVADSLDCAVVASCLGIDIDALARALVELQEMRLVEHSPESGLRLTNLDGLDELAREPSARSAS